MNYSQTFELNTGWINTSGGKKFYPLDPDIQLFDIRDQAWALASINRYNGHTATPIPVATHSIVMANVIQARFQDQPDLAKRLAQWALVHDNHEAYVGDILKPLKDLPEFAWFRQLEKRYERLISEWLKLDGDEMPSEVRQLDAEMCYYESRFFRKVNHDWKFPEPRLYGGYESAILFDLSQHSTPERAFSAYLNRFVELFGEEVYHAACH